VTTHSIWAAHAITPDATLERVRVQVEGGRIVEVSQNQAPDPGEALYEDGTLIPGLVDLQVNGGDGGLYGSEDPDEHRRANEFHLRSGTTSLLATLITAPLPEIESALARLAQEVASGGPVVGVHLEGPFLAAEKVGAHDRRHLRDPDRTTVDRILDAASGALRLMTLAPELPGALDAVERIADAGIVPAAGHSLAGLACLRAAIDRGLRFMTHVGNASDWPTRAVDPDLGFRVTEPGMVGTFLIEHRLRGSLILDGWHLQPEIAGAIIRLRGARNVALVSDATHAAGLPPGRHRRGALDLQVHPEGYATAGEGLAGSVIPLVEAVRTAVRLAGLSLKEAVRAATRTPAEVLGLERRKGILRKGSDADLVVLAPDMGIRAVYRAGALVGGEGPDPS
jgi:N-acetylglucosamine-6-phosphate deacetylase